MLFSLNKKTGVRRGDDIAGRGWGGSGLGGSCPVRRPWQLCLGFSAQPVALSHRLTGFALLLGRCRPTAAARWMVHFPVWPPLLVWDRVSALRAVNAKATGGCARGGCEEKPHDSGRRCRREGPELTIPQNALRACIFCFSRRDGRNSGAMQAETRSLFPLSKNARCLGFALWG